MMQKKLNDKISLNFPELFIIEKHVKIRSKNRGSPYYFLTSRDQKFKNITDVIPKILFLFTFLISFFMGLLTQRLIYTMNMWLTLCLAHFLNKVIH